MLRALVVLSTVAFAFAPATSAQNEDLVPITVIVVDPSGAAVGNACVTGAKYGHGLGFAAEADAVGKLRLRCLRVATISPLLLQALQKRCNILM